MYPSQKLSPSRWRFAKLRRHLLLSPLGIVAVEGDWPTASTAICVKCSACSFRKKRELGAPSLVLPRLDKEAENSLFAKRLGCFHPV
jgi:hypothetical protein